MNEELYLIEKSTGKKRKAIELICEYCGNTYLCRKDRLSITKFCSKKCKQESIKNQVTLKCHNCKTIFTRCESQLKNSKHGYYFCSSKCQSESISLDGNGEGFRPKHFGLSKKPCIICGELTTNKYCSKECRSSGTHKVAYDIVQNMSMKDFAGKNSAKYRYIRDLCRLKYKKGEMICQATGYSKHVEVCHIIALSKFNENTPISVMNDERNIVLLSPNSHWELDHGELSLSEINPEIEKRHSEFLDECHINGWIK